jgi:hypothetical protein
MARKETLCVKCSACGQRKIVYCEAFWSLSGFLEKQNPTFKRLLQSWVCLSNCLHPHLKRRGIFIEIIWSIFIKLAPSSLWTACHWITRRLCILPLTARHSGRLVCGPTGNSREEKLEVLIYIYIYIYIYKHRKFENFVAKKAVPDFLIEWRNKWWRHLLSTSFVICRIN